MSTEKEFDDLVSFVSNAIIQSCGCGVTVDTLQQTLCKQYGPDYFCTKRNADLLADTVEYLLYTKRATLAAPNCCDRR